MLFEVRIFANMSNFLVWVYQYHTKSTIFKSESCLFSVYTSAYGCGCRLSRDLYQKLLATKSKLMEHGTNQRYRKMREVSEAAAIARSLLHKKVRQLRSSATPPSRPIASDKNQHASATSNQHSTEDTNERPTSASTHSVKVAQQSPPGISYKHQMNPVP